MHAGDRMQPECKLLLQAIERMLHNGAHEESVDIVMLEQHM